jgi:hypothetical protein
LNAEPHSTGQIFAESVERRICSLSSAVENSLSSRNFSAKASSYSASDSSIFSPPFTRQGHKRLGNRAMLEFRPLVFVILRLGQMRAFHCHEVDDASEFILGADGNLERTGWALRRSRII